MLDIHARYLFIAARVQPEGRHAATTQEPSAARPDWARDLVRLRVPQDEPRAH